MVSRMPETWAATVVRRRCQEEEVGGHEVGAYIQDLAEALSCGKQLSAERTLGNLLTKLPAVGFRIVTDTLVRFRTRRSWTETTRFGLQLYTLKLGKHTLLPRSTLSVPLCYDCEVQNLCDG